MIIKAGTILIKDNQVGLVYRDYYNDYTFPKGHLEKGESILECAIRETEEETKVSVTLLKEDPIYVEEYIDSKGNKCECTYYLVKYNGKSDNKSLEVHELIWVNFDEVYNKLTYLSSKELWNNIKNEVSKYIV